MCSSKYTNSNLNKSQVVGNKSGDRVFVKHYNWSSWFDTLGFSKIPNILQIRFYEA